MPVSRNDARVQCPFYYYDDRQTNGTYRIICEGLGGSNSVAHIYRRKAPFQRQIDAVCCDRYRDCELYLALMRKYGEDGKA